MDLRVGTGTRRVGADLTLVWPGPPPTWLRLHALPYADRVLEYPIGSGWLLYLAAVIAPSPMGVLVATAIGATVLCAVITIVAIFLVCNKVYPRS